VALRAVLVFLLVVAAVAQAHHPVPRGVLRDPNASGVIATVSTGGVIDPANPFFRSVGSNGRSCASCHDPAEGWTITPAGARRRFEASEGHDPLFHSNDGSVSPRADVSTVEARRSAYRLLLDRGLIRVGRPVPPKADFSVDAIDDPYGYATAAELSVFRRPLPTTNLRFGTSIMWDGREATLDTQADGATREHALSVRALGADERASIVGLESALYTAQISDNAAGALDADGARGGPRPLSDQPFHPGINTGASADRAVFTLFTPWADARGRLAPGRQAIARGEAIFNQRAFRPRGVSCSTCHDAPNAGSNSSGAFVSLGLSDAGLRTPDLPVYTLRCTSGGGVMRTTDPGRALVTGRCEDIGRFKIPTLRGLAARAPYFHNGSAATLEDVVEYYDRRFSIGFTASERADLIAFLRAL
jgi:cytochrome c peroxidase